MKIFSVLKQILLIVAVLALSISCDKNEGYGGSSSIEGVLMMRYYNNDFTVLQDVQPAVDEDVFILFGDDKNVGDDIETSIGGNFRFNYLLPGKYKLYYMSDDTSKTRYSDIALYTDVEIGSGEKLFVDTLYTYKALDWDDGHAKIKGRVMLWNYKKSSAPPNLEVKDYTPAQELPVYIVYNHGDFYEDRIRTQGDGTFVFPNLLKGHYRIFVYSEDIYTGSTADFIISRELEITETNQVLVLDDFEIETY